MKFKELAKREGRSALVSGGTSGIGKCFAIELAKHGFGLTIIARRQALLDEVKETLEAKYQVKVNAISADLSKPDWRAQVGIDKLAFDLIVNSAGDGYPGEFGSREQRFDREIIQLNCITPMEITHEALPYLKQKGGGIILVSSTLGYLGIPFMANYAASKSFLLHFGEALFHELKGKNISVEVLAPGATRTPALNKYNVNYKALPVRWMDPEEVVEAALNGLGSKAVVIPGWTNWFTAGISSCFLLRKQIQKLMKKYSSRVLRTSNKP